MEKDGNVKVIVIMRHGERIDLVDKSKQKLSEYDPELTEIGIKQAINIGKRIKNQCDFNFDVINMYSSPFTRTIMTGYNVINCFDNCNKKNIYLIDDLGEYMNPNGFKYNPFPSLLANNPKNFLYKKFFINEGLNFQKMNLPVQYIKYPETFDDMYKRYNELGKCLFEKITHDNEKKNKLEIIVSHGYGVQILTGFFISQIKENNKKIDKDFMFVDYCGTFCFNYCDNKLKFVDELTPLVD